MAVTWFDAPARRLLIYGGQRDAPGASPQYLTDLWSWDGAAWSLVSTDGPNLVAPMGAFDPIAHKVILLGTPPSGPPAQTWSWNGGWSQLHPAVTPLAREGGAIAYDSTSQEIVLFGGINIGSGELADTWTWRGADWTLLHPLHSPSARFLASMCDAKGGVLLFGGHPIFADTWVWNGFDWLNLTSSAAPPGRDQATCASIGDGRVVLFSGMAANGSLLPDTWTWDGVRWSGPSAR